MANSNGKVYRNYPREPAGGRVWLYKTVDPEAVISCLGCGVEDAHVPYGTPTPNRFDLLRHEVNCPYVSYSGGFLPRS